MELRKFLFYSKEGETVIKLYRKEQLQKISQYPKEMVQKIREIIELLDENYERTGL